TALVVDLMVYALKTVKKGFSPLTNYYQKELGKILPLKTKLKKKEIKSNPELEKAVITSCSYALSPQIMDLSKELVPLFQRSYHSKLVEKYTQHIPKLGIDYQQYKKDVDELINLLSKLDILKDFSLLPFRVDKKYMLDKDTAFLIYHHLLEKYELREDTSAPNTTAN
ncbi:MAG: hypothetical protein GXN99_00940, partial [Candidatus Nanohaloarchaeota archaeon]|nr:hypothetical protein [Candidatus Nanohaloarchaeota archaeon]